MRPCSSTPCKFLPQFVQARSHTDRHEIQGLQYLEDTEKARTLHHNLLSGSIFPYDLWNCLCLGVLPYEFKDFLKGSFVGI